MINWKAVGTRASVVAAVLGIIGAVEAMDLRWWVWKSEFTALASELKVAGSDFDSRLRQMEQSLLIRDQVDIRIRLRDLRREACLAVALKLREGRIRIVETLCCRYEVVLFW